ncbi:5-bromo-4-chloroindolyl phosphate hydrolysis family protein [Candidatus Phycosocius spiralis]|uniref:5-bromo-4-chloroindolyl phosphate hydrolysis protein n=1 Tax=Candidatus Phycosocius spiralis TaxID=2815099 RepID=A0ABQ4PSV9_9PROT|nr:5-bromo-4-chloroindolyl phosphate hydrolysis family protein [Candidatus Phycosocius spiralis]GIU66072.1 hypothetical protein PsB1_0226 [Candidatus Phycosocius spiralis]
MKQPSKVKLLGFKQNLSHGLDKVRAIGSLLYKCGLAVLGLLGVLIGFIQRMFGLALRETYEALDRRHEEQIKQGIDKMGRRSDWRDTDDEDDRRAYSRKMEEARRRYELEIRAARDVQRQERRAQAGLKAGWTVASVGSGIFLAAVIGDALNPLAGIGFGIMIGGFVSWIGSSILSRSQKTARLTNAIPVPARPEIKAPTVSENTMPQGRTELVQQVLAEAAAALRALDGTVSRLRHPDSVASVARIVAVGNRLMLSVAANPEKLGVAQRVFTYYCPETVKVADALAKLEADTDPDIERISGTQTVLKKLEVLFERTELELKADEGKELDIDLRLLDQSIETDLRSR